MNLRPVLMVFLCAACAFAQKPAEPGPEVRKLDYFAGTWKGEGTIPPGPWGAGGKYSVTHTPQWLDGRYFLLCHSDIKMPPELGGESTSDGFTGFDNDKKLYTYMVFQRTENRKEPLLTLLIPRTHNL